MVEHFKQDPVYANVSQENDFSSFFALIDASLKTRRDV